MGTNIVGTYGYMAPEQFRGAAQPASDLYGLGGTLLCLLSGAGRNYTAPVSWPQVPLLSGTEVHAEPGDGHQIEHFVCSAPTCMISGMITAILPVMWAMAVC